VPAGQSVTALSQSTDLLPTILDAVGIDPPDEVQGRSLLADAANAADAADAADAETVVYAEKRNGSNLMRAVVTPDGKVLESQPDATPGEKPVKGDEGTWHYYPDPVGPDLPGQIGALPPDELARRQVLLEAIWADSVALFERRTGGASHRPIRDEEIEALRELGYLDDEASASGSGPDAGDTTATTEEDAEPAPDPR
jgi:arylsulfatase A-like enzyme